MLGDSPLFFADRWALWVLLPGLVLWAATVLFKARLEAKGRRRSALSFSSLHRLNRLRPSRNLTVRRLLQATRFVTLALLVLAFARPQTGRKLTTVTTEGVDIVLAVDTSESMNALDLDADRPIERRRNRLEVAKAVVEDFVAKRTNDQIGLVVFGTEAFTQCPLTLDHGIVAGFLERLEINMAGQATAIGSAVGTAVKRLRDSEARSKVIILLTDGRSNAGPISPSKAAEVAATFGVKIYTIGVGTRGAAPFLVETFFGPDVQYQEVEMDEATLEAMAEVSGGAYFRAVDTQSLAAIYEEIDRLEKTEITMESYMEYDERFRWLVTPALGLLLFEVLLLGTRFRKLP